MHDSGWKLEVRVGRCPWGSKWSLEGRAVRRYRQWTKALLEDWSLRKPQERWPQTLLTSASGTRTGDGSWFWAPQEITFRSASGSLK